MAHHANTPFAILDGASFGAAALAWSKRGRRVSVCLPARNEEATVGAIVAEIDRTLVHGARLVDEILVVDDASQDATAAVARAAGARVLSSDDPRGGKGAAMWTGLRAASGDVIVFLDADVRDFDPSFVVGLAGPLLAGEGIEFVKGCYERPCGGKPGEGGRVTELLAKPLLRRFFPALSGVAQPLAGECAARRGALARLPFVHGYGVDIALLIDALAGFGAPALAQVDLGVRTHRNRPLADLGRQADAVLATVLARAGLAPPVAACPPLSGSMLGSGAAGA